MGRLEDELAVGKYILLFFSFDALHTIDIGSHMQTDLHFSSSLFSHFTYIFVEKVSFVDLVLQLSLSACSFATILQQLSAFSLVHIILLNSGTKERHQALSRSFFTASAFSLEYIVLLNSGRSTRIEHQNEHSQAICMHHWGWECSTHFSCSPSSSGLRNKNVHPLQGSS